MNFIDQFLLFCSFVTWLLDRVELLPWYLISLIVVGCSFNCSRDVIRMLIQITIGIPLVTLDRVVKGLISHVNDFREITLSLLFLAISVWRSLI